MPARYNPLVTNYYYHVYNRGVNKRPLFHKKKDYKRAINLIKFYRKLDYPIRFSKFLQLSNNQRKEIWQRLEKSNAYVDIIAYCLMPNHFHFLIIQKSDIGTSKFMANFQNSYAKYFNIKYKRIGPLFQGQFKAVKIDSEEQLLHVSRYIHLNPYSSAIVKNTEKLLTYKWSSLPEYLNTTDFPFCSKEIILNNFSDDLESYKKFILDNADYQKGLENIKHLTVEQ